MVLLSVLKHLKISLPTTALKASVFPGLKQALLSLGIFCDARLTVLLTANHVSVMQNDITIAIGDRETNGLWSINLYPRIKLPTPLATTSAYYIYITYDTKSKKELVTFLHK